RGGPLQPPGPGPAPIITPPRPLGQSRDPAPDGHDGPARRIRWSPAPTQGTTGLSPASAKRPASARVQADLATGLTPQYTRPTNMPASQPNWHTPTKTTQLGSPQC